LLGDVSVSRLILLQDARLYNENCFLYFAISCNGDYSYFQFISCFTSSDGKYECIRLQYYRWKTRRNSNDGIFWRVLVKYASTHSKRRLTLPKPSKENGLKWDFTNGEFEPLPIENIVKSIGTWSALKSILLIPCTIDSKPSGYVTYNSVCRV